MASANGLRRAAAVPDASALTRGLWRMLVRGWVPIGAGLTLAALLLAMAWSSGGYFPSGHVRVGAIAIALSGALLMARPLALSGPAMAALGALLGLGVWTALSAGWSEAPPAAGEDVQRMLVYAGLFTLALLAAGSGRHARALPWLALFLCAVIGGSALISRLYPGVIYDGASYEVIGNYRLGYPIGYWNGLGCVAAMGTILGVGLAADGRSFAWARGLAAATATALATCLYLTLSRGSWLALIAGAIVLAAFGVRRTGLGVSAAIVGIGSLILCARLQGLGALLDDPLSGSGQTAQGRELGPTLLFVCVACGVGQGLLAGSARSVPMMDLRRRVKRPLLIGLAGALLLGGIVVYAAAADRVEGHSAQAIQDMGDWADRQWDEFMDASAPVPVGTERLTTARGTRSKLWGVALNGLAAHPLWGDGAGSFEYRWIRERDVDERVRDAHSLYLETLSELGLVGFALLLVLAGAVVRAGIRSRLRPGGLGRSQTAAVAGACTVWLVHAGADWDWQLPAVTGIALVLAAALMPEGRRRRRTRAR